jgi:pimeloyl-ACP methyl ester carboxylesterase
VCGGSVDRHSNDALAALLSSDFTVHNYDRRGRGDSGDTAPYAVEREIEDIAAVADAAGGSARLYGTSSGAALALEAALRLGERISRLALWEPPYIRDPDARPPADQVEQYERMIVEGRRGDAAEYFMRRVVGMPEEFVSFARSQPWWADQERIAHTLAYDARIMGDYSIPLERAAALRVPALLMAGGESFPFMLDTARALAEAIPDAELELLEGQSHDAPAEALAPPISAFFNR